MKLKIMQDMLDDIRVEDKNTTVNDVYEFWISNKIGLKKSTFGNYQYMYEQYVKDYLGKFRIQELRKSDVVRFYNRLIDNRGLAINTIKAIHTVLHQVFQVAVDNDYIKQNLTEGVLNWCKQARNCSKTKRHALTIPEQKAFVSYIRETPKYKHWLPLFTFLLGTGCRVSEIAGLTWSNVDMDNNLIKICQSTVSYDRENEKTYHYLSVAETGAEIRYIPMLKDVKQALLNEKAYQKEVGIESIVNIDGQSDFVFLNRFGNVHNPQTINRAIKRIVRSYNSEEAERALKEDREGVYLPDFSCHNLRRTFAIRFCENETNLKVIQSILGYKDIQTTMNVYAEATMNVYTGAIKDVSAEAFQKLEGKIRIS